MKKLFLTGVAILGVSFPATAADPPSSQNAEQPTKATYLITGLHCPPCTKTVESSLKRVRGIKSVKVDWKTKNAQVEFDESAVPAQTLAHLIAETPHMMGGDMEYAGWLALKTPEVKDAKLAEQAKSTLSQIRGVKKVAVYPKQGSIGVQFGGQGKVTTQELIDALQDAGLEASNF